MRAAKTFRIDIAQTVPPTPGQPTKEPMLIPLAVGLVGRDGSDLPLKLAGGGASSAASCLCASPPEAFVFEDIAEPPVMSLNRNFSAPVRVVANLSGDDLRFLAAHDRDPFNRWQAVQSLATRLLVDNVAAIRSGGAPRERRRPARRARRDPRRRRARARLRVAGADAAERSRHRARDRPQRRSRRDLQGAHRVARSGRQASRRRARRTATSAHRREPLSAGRRRRRTPRAAQHLPRSPGRGAARRARLRSPRSNIATPTT